jgi:hypothetical protein
MNLSRAITVVMLAAFIGGCASTSATRSKSEPGTIALLNSTGAKLKSVRIREDRDGAGSLRLGEMSPVLPDFTYPFGRSSNAPALPSRVRVQWVDASNRERSAVVDIDDVLKQATGSPDEALLFEIRPGGTVDARIDRVSMPR